MSGSNADALEEARALTNRELLERTESYVRRVEPPQPGLPLGPEGEPRQWEIGEAVYGYESDKVEYVVGVHGEEGEVPINMQIQLSSTPGGPTTGYGFAAQLRRVPPEPLDRHDAMTVIRERVEVLQAKAAPTREEKRELAKLDERFKRLLNWKPPLGHGV